MNASRTHTRFPHGNEGLMALCPPASVLRPPSSVFSPPSSVLRPQSSCLGMTLIELCLVMGIVAGLIALVLGLGRHVNEVIKIRRAQADLCEWHENLNTWHLKFGMYPDPTITPFNINGPVDSNIVWLASSKDGSQYYVENLPTQPRIPFCSLASKPLHTTDPWGTVYVYQSFTNSYILFSCGPNGVHEADGFVIPENTQNLPSEPNVDDIYFEL